MIFVSFDFTNLFRRLVVEIILYDLINTFAPNAK